MNGRSRIGVWSITRAAAARAARWPLRAQLGGAAGAVAWTAAAALEAGAALLAAGTITLVASHWTAHAMGPPAGRRLARLATVSATRWAAGLGAALATGIGAIELWQGSRGGGPDPATPADIHALLSFAVIVLCVVLTWRRIPFSIAATSCETVNGATRSEALASARAWSLCPGWYLAVWTALTASTLGAAHLALVVLLIWDLPVELVSGLTGGAATMLVAGLYSVLANPTEPEPATSDAASRARPRRWPARTADEHR